MKNEKLLEALGKVNETFIEEAAPTGEAMQEAETEKSMQGADESVKPERMLQVTEDSEESGLQKKQPAISRSWIKWVAIAACAVLVIGFGATRVLWTINDDTRSFWPSEEDYAFALTEDMVTALSESGADYTMDTSVADEGFPDWGLTLSVKGVTPAGLTLVCRKEGGNPTGLVKCGTDYHLLVLEDGTWKDVPTVIEDYGWNSLAYNFTEGQDTELACSWEWLYGKLPAGTYRLTKGFMDFRGAGDYDTAVYWVEFEIE